MEKHILHIETSTRSCSLCLSRAEKPWIIRELSDTADHAALLTVFISELMQQVELPLAALDAIALSIGPGSYTGLRIGASVAKGLAYSLKKPLVGVDTLGALADALAAEYREQEALYLPIIDARRMDAYTAVYDSRGQRLGDIACETLSREFLEHIAQGKKLILGGNAQGKLQEALGGQVPDFLQFSPLKSLSAKFLTKRAYSAFLQEEFLDIAYFEPFYLKPPAINSKAKQKV